jgi:hypothetical protein
MEEQGIDHAEDGDIGADSESEDEDGNEGEAGIFAQRAGGVAEVAEEIVDKMDAADVAALLFAEFKAVDVAEGGAAGVIGREAESEVVLRFAFEMVAEFFVEFLLDLVAIEERTKAMRDGVEPVHWALAHFRPPRA